MFDAMPPRDVMLRSFFSGEMGSLNEGPKAGVPAPNFVLKSSSDQAPVHLKKLLGTRPVVLIFGSFSCGFFRNWAPVLVDIAERYKDRATFIGVYVREAHPADGWQKKDNLRDGIIFHQPKTYSQRTRAAELCQSSLKFPFPLLVDELDDPVGRTYSGMPARLYVIDSHGVVTFQSARAPFGFRPAEMEQALALTLLAETPAKAR